MVEKGIISSIEEKTRVMRKLAIDAAVNSGKRGISSHIGPGFSIMEIMATLYFHVLKHNPENPRWEDRDRVILSKGHGVLGLYSALALAGYFSTSLLENYDPDNTELAGHPCMNLDYGIEASTGSLGHGLPMAVGYSIAAKLDKKKFTIYCIVGDGECDEGSIWEAFMTARKYNLDNLVVIIDRNNLQASGTCSEIMDLNDISMKLQAFGWKTREIDGHNIEEIINSLDQSNRPTGHPYAVIAHTVKGKGVSIFENNVSWHSAKLYADNAKIAYEELGF